MVCYPLLSELMRDGTQSLQGLGLSVPAAHVQGHNCSLILAFPTGGRDTACG